MARAAIALTVLLLLLASCSSGDQSEAAREVPAATDDADAADDAPAGGLSGRDGEAEAPREPSAVEDLDLPATSSPASTGERIIKEGTVAVEVEAGRFDAAFGRVISAATRLGGTVVSSTTRTGDSGGTSGSVTVRVPVERYEDLLVGIGEIGTIVSRQVTAQDVTAEFTDLESRLRHLRAQERFYLGLLEDAVSVSDAISVQQQLGGIQGQMEQVQGRIQLLDARTTFSTLTVELFEPGTPLRPTGSQERPNLGHYWEQARDAFVHVVGSLLVAVLFVAPLLVPLTAGFLIWRGWRRRRALAVPPPAPAPRREEPTPTAPTSPTTAGEPTST